MGVTEWHASHQTSRQQKKSREHHLTAGEGITKLAQHIIAHIERNNKMKSTNKTAILIQKNAKTGKTTIITRKVYEDNQKRPYVKLSGIYYSLEILILENNEIRIFA